MGSMTGDLVWVDREWRYPEIYGVEEGVKPIKEYRAFLNEAFLEYA